MPRQHGPWIVKATTPKYHNAFIEVREDQVTQPDGQPGVYATVTMRPGVAVLPVDDDGRVSLVRQFRYALGRESLEVVSGAIEAGESALAGAQRELREELGLTAAAWTDLGRMDLDTSILHGPVQLFLAQRLTCTAAAREGTETIQPVQLPWEEAVRRVMASAISHGPSCVLILKVQLVRATPT